MNRTVLTIRIEQLHLMERASAARHAEEYRRILRASMHSSLAPMDTHGIQCAAKDAMQRAEGYGLNRPQDVRSYVTLTAEYGIAFEDALEHAWMRSPLIDAAVTAPAQRMALLLDRIAWRARITRQNETLRAAFAQQAGLHL